MEGHRVEEIGRIISQYAKDEDGIQDAWVEILDKGAETDEQVTQIARNYRWGILRIGNDVRGDRTLRDGSGNTLFDILIAQPTIPFEDGGATKELIEGLMQTQRRQIKGGNRGNHHIDKDKNTRPLFHMKAPQKVFELTLKLRQEGMPIEKIVDHLLLKVGHKYSSSTIHTWCQNPNKLVDPLSIMRNDTIPLGERKPTFSRPRTPEERAKISKSVQETYRLKESLK